MTDSHSRDSRTTRFESALMHLQREVEQLHEVILAQQKEIELLRRDLGRLHRRIERLQDGEPEDEDPNSERPPHY